MWRPPRRSARGRSVAVLAAVLVVATVGWPGGVRPALAHEFTLALVTPTSGTTNADLNGSDVVDGFRFAVDQSPDVSHPPGADAGDHLGGVDVDVIVIDGTQATEAAEAVQQQVDTGLTTVVLIAGGSTARAVTKELETSSVLLVTAEGAGANARSDTSDLHLTQRPAPSLQSGVAADVAAAFDRAHGRELSPAAALGYDAGRLLDAAVAGADDGVEDLESVVAAASEVNNELVSSEVSAPEQSTAEPQLTSSPDAPADSGPEGLSLVVVATGLLLGLGGLVGWSARRRRDRAG